jgi:acyl-CoA hydrolase
MRNPITSNGFVLDCCNSSESKLPEYNSVFDRHMANYFTNKKNIKRAAITPIRLSRTPSKVRKDFAYPDVCIVAGTPFKSAGKLSNSASVV